MQTYYVVVGANREDALDIEVRARKYADVKCPCCKQQVGTAGYSARLDAAYADGLAFGKMLRAQGIGEFERGLFVGLGLKPRC